MGGGADRLRARRVRVKRAAGGGRHAARGGACRRAGAAAAGSPHPQPPPCSDAQAYIGAYPAASPPVAPPGSTAATSLPTFTALPAPPGGASDCGALIATGGPVWGLDWAPATAGRLLAVAAAPAARASTPLTATVAGPALVQVWTVPLNDEPPSLAIALAVDGGVARAVKWRPARAAAAPASAAGILAAIQSDGSLTVWVIPTPDHAAAAFGGRAGPRVARATPLAAAPTGGPPTALAWSPRAPYDELITASADGSATLWRLESGGDGGAALTRLLRTPARGPPLRAAAFPPPEIGLAHPGVPALRPFAVAGHGGDGVVWDATRPGAPTLTAPAPRAWTMAVAWLAAPLGLLLAQDGGKLTLAPLEGVSSGGTPPTTMWSLEQGRTSTVWDVAALSATSVVAYATGAGDVAAFDVLPVARGRGPPRPHAPLSGFRRLSGGALAAPRVPDLAADARLATREGQGKTGRAGAATPRQAAPDAGLAVHRVAWRRGRGARATLAAGGGAGLVRVHEVDVQAAVG